MDLWWRGPRPGGSLIAESEAQVDLWWRCMRLGDPSVVESETWW